MKKIDTAHFARQDLQSVMNRGGLLFEQVFSPDDAGVENRTFHVWKAKGLVDFVGKGKWARLSFIQLIWLRLLESLRRFGCPVSQMKKLYDHFFIQAYKDNLASQVLSHELQMLEKLALLRPLTEEELTMRAHLHTVLSDRFLMLTLRSEISYFSLLVMDCLQYQAERGLIIYEDGTFRTYSNDRAGSESTIPSDQVEKPHIRIPISSYILDFVTDENRLTYLQKTELFNEDEYRVVKEMRNKNLRSLTVYFGEEPRRVTKIECDEAGLIKGEEARKVMALLGLKNYSSIELKTRDGNSLSFIYKQKKYLNDSA